MTPREIFDNQIKNRAAHPDVISKVNAAYRFNITGPDGGSWIVDLRQGSAGVREGNEAASCTITMSDSNFVSMIDHKLNVQLAFLSGKIKVSGDMGLALKLGELL